MRGDDPTGLGIITSEPGLTQQSPPIGHAPQGSEQRGKEYDLLHHLGRHPAATQRGALGRGPVAALVFEQVPRQIPRRGRRLSLRSSLHRGERGHVQRQRRPVRLVHQIRRWVRQRVHDAQLAREGRRCGDVSRLALTPRVRELAQQRARKAGDRGPRAGRAGR
jgi:hypothetical protein